MLNHIVIKAGIIYALLIKHVINSIHYSSINPSIINSLQLLWTVATKLSSKASRRPLILATTKPSLRRVFDFSPTHLTIFKPSSVLLFLAFAQKTINSCRRQYSKHHLPTRSTRTSSSTMDTISISRVTTRGLCNTYQRWSPPSTVGYSSRKPSTRTSSMRSRAAGWPNCWPNAERIKVLIPSTICWWICLLHARVLSKLRC